MPDIPHEFFEAPDLDAMHAIGTRIGSRLRAGDVVALSGDLGAGKTTLTRSIVAALGIDPAIVSSPTFVLINIYPNPGGPDVAHADAYRLGSAEDLDSLGWERVANNDHIVIVEWPERIEGALPESRWRVEIHHAPEGRSVRLHPPPQTGAS